MPDRLIAYDLNKLVAKEEEEDRPDDIYLSLDEHAAPREYLIMAKRQGEIDN
jgi:hypothetical protein